VSFYLYQVMPNNILEKILMGQNAEVLLLFLSEKTQESHKLIHFRQLLCDQSDSQICCLSSSVKPCVCAVDKLGCTGP
jgi:hypothetical protein